MLGLPVDAQRITHMAGREVAAVVGGDGGEDGLYFAFPVEPGWRQ
jgi:hypothetical protein